MYLRCIVLFLVIMVGRAHASVFSYECGSFPGEAGWEAINELGEQWIEDGCLFQHVQLFDGVPPPGGQQFDYGRSLGEFLNEHQFFIEWRMQTNGARSEIVGTAPAAMVLGGLTGVNYHFTIARDQVRFIRDNDLPILFADIEPEIFHTYRLELFGDELYAWYIDGQVIDSGVPEGAYLTSDSNNVKWRAKSWYLDSTTQWDYIRFGTIPEPGTGLFALIAVGGLVLFRRRR